MAAVREELASTQLFASGLKPLSPSLQPLIQALFFAGLLSRSCTSRFLLFIPIVITSTYILFYTTSGKDISDMETANSIAVLLFKASDSLVLTDVAKLRLVGQKKDTNELGLWERIKWALKLMASPRQIGWTHEPRHVLPPHPTESRWEFVYSRVVRCLGYYVMTDLVNTYMAYSPAFSREGVSIAEGGIWIRLLNTGMLAALSWYFFSLMYTLIAIVAVATHLTDASEWPALYGKWSDAYTVRRFWGRTWHQNLRQVLTAHGDFVAFRLLRLQKNTFLGTNVQRYAAFAASGILHAITEYGLFRSKYWELSNAISFFLLQATVIMVEQEVGKLLGLKTGKWTRRAGYVWTFCWFAWTFPAWIDPQIRYGFNFRHVFWERDGFVGSMANYVWKGEWRIRSS